MSAALDDLGGRVERAAITLAQAAALHAMRARALDVQRACQMQLTHIILERPARTHLGTMAVLVQEGLVTEIRRDIGRSLTRKARTVVRYRLTDRALRVLASHNPAAEAAAGGA